MFVCESVRKNVGRGARSIQTQNMTLFVIKMVCEKPCNQNTTSSMQICLQKKNRKPVPFFFLGKKISEENYHDRCGPDELVVRIFFFFEHVWKFGEQQRHNVIWKVVSKQAKKFFGGVGNARGLKFLLE